MSDESILKVWKYIIIGVVALFAVSATSCQVTNQHIAAAIEAGADPLAARCALDTANTNSGECLLYGAAK
jgi:hypothetical protein